MHRIFLLSIFIFSFFISCRSGQTGSTSDTPEKIPEIPPELTVQPGWKTDMDQFSLVGERGSDWLHVIGYSGNQNQLRPMDQMMLALSDGTIRWKRRRTMRSFGENAPWAIRAFAPDSRQIFYETRYKALFSLSIADGKSDRVLGNVFHFAPCGKGVFVGTATPTLWDPEEKKHHPIDGMNPLFEEIHVETSQHFPATALSEDIVAFRSRDGALRAVSCTEKRQLWQFSDPLDRKTWSTDLPVSGDTVLVSTFMPPFLPRIRIEGAGADELQLPGSLQSPHLVSFTGNRASFVTSEGLHMVTLMGVDLETGQSDWQVELPVLPCTVTESFHVCRNGRNVFAIDLATGKKTTDVTLPEFVRFINAHGDWVAAQTSDEKIHLIHLRENRLVASEEIIVRNAPVRMVSLALVDEDRVAMILHTRWPQREHLERLYMVSFSIDNSSQRVEIQLGKPYQDKEPQRVANGERTVLLPVWVHEGQLFSAVDGMFGTVDIRRGLRQGSYNLPGRGSVSLLKVTPEGHAVLEREDLLIVTRPRGGILWTSPLRGSDVHTVSSKYVVTIQSHGFTALNLLDGNPVSRETGLPAMPSIRAVAQDRIFYHLPGGGHVFENGASTPHRGLPSLSLHPKDRDLLVFPFNEPPPGKGVWVALDRNTGKSLWRKVVTRTPEIVGGARDIGEIEPKEAAYHPPSWIRASADGFWIPDPSHRCLYLIESADGSVAWALCAQRLGSPPVFTPDGEWMILPAAGPWHEPGQPIEEGATIERTLSLVAIHLKTKTRQVLYTPPENHSVVNPISNPPTWQLVFSVIEEKFKNPKVYLQSLELGKRKPGEETGQIH